MSNTALVSLPIKRYETLGLLFPGAVVLFSFLYLVSAISGSFPEKFALTNELLNSAMGHFYRKDTSLAHLVLLVIVLCILALVTGNITEGASRWFFETSCFDRIYGYPYQHLLNLHSDFGDRRYLILRRIRSKKITSENFIEKYQKQKKLRIKKTLTNLLFHKAGLWYLILGLFLVPLGLLLNPVSESKSLLGLFVFVISAAIFFVGCLSIILSIYFFIWFVRTGKHRRRYVALCKNSVIKTLVVKGARRFEQLSDVVWVLSGIEGQLPEVTITHLVATLERQFKLDNLSARASSTSNFYRDSDPYWLAYWKINKEMPDVIDKLNKYVNLAVFNRNFSGAVLMALWPVSAATYLISEHKWFGWTWLIFSLFLFIFLWARFFYFYIFTTKTVLRNFQLLSLQGDNTNAHTSHQSTHTNTEQIAVGV